jgi:hypothetical protein
MPVRVRYAFEVGEFGLVGTVSGDDGVLGRRLDPVAPWPLALWLGLGPRRAVRLCQRSGHGTVPTWRLSSRGLGQPLEHEAGLGLLLRIDAQFVVPQGRLQPPLLGDLVLFDPDPDREFKEPQAIVDLPQLRGDVMLQPSGSRFPFPGLDRAKELEPARNRSSQASASAAWALKNRHCAWRGRPAKTSSIRPPSTSLSREADTRWRSPVQSPSILACSPSLLVRRCQSAGSMQPSGPRSFRVASSG